MKRHTQFINFAQLLLAPLPAYLLSRHLLSSGGRLISTPTGLFGLLKGTTLISSSQPLSPFELANLLLALSLSLGWLASLLQESTWLIDPYWTLVPPLLDAFYKKACKSNSDETFFSSSPRAAAATLLLFLWSLRLTHSYFRREGWRLGDREDWRYAEMRREWGRNWWWWQVVPVYFVQHFLLVGLALPSFALRCCSGSGSGSDSSSSPFGGCLSSCVSSSEPSSSSSASVSSSSISSPLGGLLSSLRGGGGTKSSAASPPSSSPSYWHPLFDSLAVAAALSGLFLALVADTQLHAFVSSKEEQEKKKRGKAAVLERGLWALSRHPNYFGETIFHLSLAALAVSGRYFSSDDSILFSLSVLWPLAGVALNTACLLAVTRMTEQRTAAARGRAKAWEGYCSRVPCWIPRARAVVSALGLALGSSSSSSSSSAAERPRARRRKR